MSKLEVYMQILSKLPRHWSRFILDLYTVIARPSARVYTRNHKEAPSRDLTLNTYTQGGDDQNLRLIWQCVKTLYPW